MERVCSEGRVRNLITSGKLRSFVSERLQMTNVSWRNRNNNLMNYTGANCSLEALSTGLTMKVRTPSTGFVAGGGLDVIWRKMSPVVMFLAELIQFPFLTTNFAVQRLLFSGVRRWEKAYHMAMEYKLQVTCL